MKESKKSLLKANKALQDSLASQHRLISGIEKEIYENIAQSLCLARINLSSLDVSDPGKMTLSLEQSGNLIAKAITDLRNLAKQVNTNNPGYIHE